MSDSHIIRGSGLEEGFGVRSYGQEHESEILVRGRGSLLITGGRGPAQTLPFVAVCGVDDLPAAVAGVITLAADTTYYFCGSIDLAGARLVTSSNTCLLGSSSENAFLTSTGLGVGVPLVTIAYTCPVRHITFKDVDTAIYCDGGGTSALDWTGVNFLNVPNIGTIKDGDNFIFGKGAFLNSQGLKFDGTMGTISIDTSLMVAQGWAGSIIELLATLTVTRRFRVIYSSMVAFGSTVGITASESATIPVEGYILDTVNFSGGGTYLSGVLNSDNKARFENCRGIPNTGQLGALYMQDNAIATTITVDVPTKAAGTTTLNTSSQRFSHSNNRLTYIGALTRLFSVSATLSLFSGNNQVVAVYIAKNGAVVNESAIKENTDGNGRTSNFGVQAIMELDENDYIEVWIENQTSGQSITVEQLNLIVGAI